MQSDQVTNVSGEQRDLPPERCRTCQKRKVKCGQEMPTCFNCRRLGLDCERRQQYRLRNVTLEVRRSVCSTISERGTVWDPSCECPIENVRATTITEATAPKSSIIQSEKGVDYTAAENIAAEEIPGTYFINATAENVLDICRDDEVSKLTDSLGPVPFDKVALRKEKKYRFREYGSRSVVSGQSKRSVHLSKNVASRANSVTTSIISSAAASTVGSLAKHFERQDINPGDKEKQLSMFDIALVQSRDLQYYNHYRNVVVYNMQVNSRIPAGLKPFCHDKNETEDTFERAAAVFRPLYHAILALSALSFSHRERLDRVDALEHYQQAVSGLREHTGPESVNLIYAHYFLLLYEVAACENGQAHLAFTHMTQLVRLLGWFLANVRTKPDLVFRDVVCYQCAKITVELTTSSTLYLDMYNLLFYRQIQPVAPDRMVVGLLIAVENGGAHIGSAHGVETLALILPKLLARGGWAHFVLRELIRDVNNPNSGSEVDISNHLLSLDDEINDMYAWCQDNSPPVPSTIWDDIYHKMPVPSQTTFDSAQFTLRATLIHAHTAIYSGQRLSLSVERTTQIDALAQEILALTRPRWGELRPIAAVNLMALFVCGTVVTSIQDKEEVIAVLRRMGSGASGRGSACAIRALEELYGEHERVKSLGGNEISVDWLVYLQMRGLLDFCPFGI